MYVRWIRCYSTRVAHETAIDTPQGLEFALGVPESAVGHDSHVASGSRGERNLRATTTAVRPKLMMTMVMMRASRRSRSRTLPDDARNAGKAPNGAEYQDDQAGYARLHLSCLYTDSHNSRASYSSTEEKGRFSCGVAL